MKYPLIELFNLIDDEVITKAKDLTDILETLNGGPVNPSHLNLIKKFLKEDSNFPFMLLILEKIGAIRKSAGGPDLDSLIYYFNQIHHKDEIEIVELTTEEKASITSYITNNL